jgi:hypothetical protein
MIGYNNNNDPNPQTVWGAQIPSNSDIELVAKFEGAAPKSFRWIAVDTVGAPKESVIVEVDNATEEEWGYIKLPADFAWAVGKYRCNDTPFTIEGPQKGVSFEVKGPEAVFTLKFNAHIREGSYIAWIGEDGKELYKGVLDAGRVGNVFRSKLKEETSQKKKVVLVINNCEILSSLLF